MVSHFFYGLAVLSVSAFTAAETQFVYPQPDPSSVVVSKDVVYRQLSTGRKLLFDHYHPSKGAGRLPVLIFMDAFGSDSSQRAWDIYQSWAKVAAGAGFAAFTFDTHNEAVEEDFDALLAYIRDHAEELHANPDRVSVYAASGHVSRAFPMLQDPKRTGVKAAILYYGAANYDGSKPFRLDLPILLVRAGLDRPGMNAAVDRLAASAIRANAPFRLLNHPGGHHGFEVLDNDDASRRVIDETLAFAKLATDPAYHAALRLTSIEAGAAAAFVQGDFERAATLYGSLVAPARATDVRLLLSYGEALTGARQYAKARQQFAKVKEIGGAGPRDLGIPAARAAALDGDAADAVKWLESIPARFRPSNLADDPVFAALKTRPDFQALLEK